MSLGFRSSSLLIWPPKVGPKQVFLQMILKSFKTVHNFNLNSLLAVSKTSSLWRLIGYQIHADGEHSYSIDTTLLNLTLL